jgi:putative ABC transport system ATP-binding protein
MTTNGSASAARVDRGVKIFGEGATEVRALDEISVAFDRGRFTAVMGPSGSGKSTLLHCQAGLDFLSDGSAYIGDTRLGDLSEKALTLLRREKVGFVFQAFNLIPTLSAAENITLPIDIAGSDVDGGWFDQVVSTMGLSDRLRHRPSELSGGQQQRVAAARALVSRPEIIFADEPTGNLDSRASEEVLTFLRRAVDDFEQTIVMVTHDPIAAAFADKVVFLVDGRCADTLDDPTVDSIIDRLRSVGD